MDRLRSSRSLLPRIILGFCLAVGPACASAMDSPQGLSQPPASAIPAPNASPYELEAQADQLRLQKRYLDSIDCYKAAIAKQPTAALWNKLGMVYLLSQHVHDAQKAFDRAIRMDKNEPKYYNNRAYIELVKKNFGKAVKYYQKALSLRPESADFHYNLGSAYFDKHEYADSAAQFRTAFTLDPAVFEHHSRAGIVALASTPEDRAAFQFMVAKMYAQLGDFDRSLEYLRKAMEDGFKGIQKVYSEPEFATLRTDKRFSELMSQKPQGIQ